MGTLKNSWLRAGAILMVFLVGIFLAVGAMEKNNKALATQWFSYNGPDQTRAEIQKPSNYTPLTSAPGCSAGTELCSIHATNNGSGQPVLSSGFVDQVMDAIATETPTPTIKLEN